MSVRPPPRSPSQSSAISNMSDQPAPVRHNTVHLTPQAYENHPYSHHTGLDDPRSSSTQSLRPVEPPGPNRRTLLIVYIHGFLGNETSFRSFPAHVHSLLSMTLSESHVVHTKIYPRYKSRKNISFARDAFSNWLVPHESVNTDVVLVGHSLGGILGAEVVLIPSHTPGSRNALQHRILGLIAFDTPFLGMHPGVVSTGIASLFRGAPEAGETSSDATTTTGSSNPWMPVDTTSSDPNFNPKYNNDVNLPMRSNKWEKAWYFWNKHYGELRQATQSYVKSHLEFGGCLADYPGLRRRYDAVRDLEDIDDLDNSMTQNGKIARRVRFVNYYTASTGRIQERKSPIRDKALNLETEMQTLKPPTEHRPSSQSSGISTPRLSLEEHNIGEVIDRTDELRIDDDTLQERISDSVSMQTVDPTPEEEELGVSHTNATSVIHDDLPPVPPEPTPPVALDEAQYLDADALRLAQKEQVRRLKAYERAKKDHQKAVRDREKVIAKRERQAEKDREKRDRLLKQDELNVNKETVKRQSTLNPEHQDKQMREENSLDQVGTKKKRDRKFCTLPGKDQYGRRDPTWIRVYMEGMDEVVAHTSLFFVSETYAKLIGDTAERIEQWITEDATTRVLLSEQSR